MIGRIAARALIVFVLADSSIVTDLDVIILLRVFSIKASVSISTLASVSLNSF